ncbi:MAG: HigA family addiction module antidote protein [Magnetococcales bacterium]|nr:HigA family addiction module antidote protein [Magnetococcales bacterium]NGZ25330.1 HigA family addiction module antidote protein [Magnetococcales bacterium]
MTIQIEDLSHLDFSEEASGGYIPPAHPGEFLKEIMEEMHLSQYGLAKSLGVSAMRISHIVHGRRPVTAEMAIRLGLCFGQSPEYWLGLQSQYDMDIAKNTMLEKLTATITPLHAA